MTLPGGGYTRWDPCDDPITFEIDAPDSSQEVVIRDALATAAVATGFQFQEVASGGEAVIGLKDFPDGTLGEGGGNFNRTTGEMTSGVAYVDVGLKDLTLRYALLHEIGHMVGLGHVASAAEVMYTFAVSPPKQQYAGGDLEGLRLVGTTMPCFPTEALRVASPEQTVIVH